MRGSIDRVKGEKQTICHPQARHTVIKNERAGETSIREDEKMGDNEMSRREREIQKTVEKNRKIEGRGAIFYIFYKF